MIFKDIASFIKYSIDLFRDDASPEGLTFRSYYASYMDYFGNAISFQFNKQTEQVCSLINKFKTSPSILEVGCGCGTETLWFALSGAVVKGIDLREDRLETARYRKNMLEHSFGINLDATFENVDIFEYASASCSQKRVDIIWMEQAFHHIEPREELPGVIYNLLSDDGFCVICESNGWNPFLQYILFRERGFELVKTFLDDNGKEHLYGNERITRPFKLIRLFEKHGFKLIFKEYFRISPNKKFADWFYSFERYIPEYLLPLFVHYTVVLQKC
ncbi:class I SAM-dependent methyltransferase [Synechococcus sp. MIT S9504]|uniref:class I SAM-dependent methyltransferase n=1 Tax=Synechococcus sp. MIT S9504 TaxID=1801628 RepID=UPI0007BC3880|nr:class I SAM-dependent methyltransferase [Synechococcus sp. MIT S9504]KZR84993.1 Ubiquinone biosynthesis O-methyltransferase [Synechococcus sp. MIT S9504]